ncbi:MAG: RNA-guided pseudouridylation complex pseudouridine synthase subunit Cbf5 [Planctomycetota bacterium]|nr:MAG: RNA-guided pseudouridylation complex pseudouridine synthase subunit Cbf5 [Planctomycetota bacterium]
MTQSIVRFQAETDMNYGSAPQERKLEDYINLSVVVVEKSKGKTAHYISKRVKEIFEDILDPCKIGHLGQLDPPLTGLVGVSLARACKLSSFLTELDRKYTAWLHFNRFIPNEKVEKALEIFEGTIKQVPPVRSRSRRILRSKDIFKLELLEYRKKKAKIFIHCESGTYVRKLLQDIARYLAWGVKISGLRRVGIGPFTLKDAVSFRELAQAYESAKNGSEEKLRQLLKPVEVCLEGFPSIYVQDSCIRLLCCGAPLFTRDIAKLDASIDGEKRVLVRSLKGEIVCVAMPVGTAEEIAQKEDNEIAAHPTRTIMSPYTYAMET